MNNPDEKPITLEKLAVEYSDEDEARKYFETLRWPDGVICPHCQSKEHYALKPSAEPRQRGKRPARKGLYKCKDCSKQFTVTVGTIMADSKIPLHKWLMAFYLLSSAKKAISAHQVHRSLGIGYKSAWFMCHRIRHAVSPLMQAEKLKGSVEVDEMYSGAKSQPKLQVVALIQRGGDVRTKVVTRISHRNIGQFLRDNVARGSTLQTDGHAVYKSTYLPAVRHDSVNHKAKEFIRERADGSKVHVNHCESFFSLFRRGVTGAFHHISNQHLHRYADEFAFRWNTRKLADGERFEIALQSCEGKRLKYHEATLQSPCA
jgi:transposase-like protein